jgi:aflatoxin B1 aldehyde reductase
MVSRTDLHAVQGTELYHSPLAGGFLTGKVTFKSEKPGVLVRTRWEGESILKHYPNLYDKPEMHEAIKHVTQVGNEEGVSVTEATLRWLLHHSALGDGDAIIMGGTKIPEIRDNVKMCRNGPLSEKLLAAMEEMANIIAKPAEA